MINVTFQGLTSFKLGVELLDKAMETKVKDVVKKTGGACQADAMRIVPKDTHTLEKSITVEIGQGGYMATVAPHTEYAVFVEKGTRFMYAQPYLFPAWDKNSSQFKKDLESILGD